MPTKKKKNTKKNTFFYPNSKKEKVEDVNELKKEGSRLFFHFFDYQLLKLRTKIKKSPKEVIFLFLTGFMISSVLTILVFNSILGIVRIGFVMPQFDWFSPQKDFFSVNSKNQIVDPYELLLRLKNHKNDFILIDLRTNQEYQKGHISTAINISGYKSPEDLTFSSDQKKRVKGMFSPLYSKGKQIVLYAQTSYSQTPSLVANLIGHTGQVSILGIGYNEWAHMKTLWVPEAEWSSINPDDFVQD